MHAAAPITFLNVPPAHSTHGPVPFGPEYPTLHWNTPLSVAYFGRHALPFAKKRSVHVHDVRPGNESLPNAHGVHAALPFETLNVPAAQGTHGPPFGPVKPASQMQLVIKPLRAAAAEFTGHILQSGLPSGDHMPAGHARQLSRPLEPTPAAYSPTEQFEQAVRASCVLYLPCVHSAHLSVPSTCANPASQ